MSELKRCEVCGEPKELWLVLSFGDKKVSCLCKCEEDELDKREALEKSKRNRQRIQRVLDEKGKREDKGMKFFVTFGWGQKNAGKVLPIIADSESQVTEYMRKNYDNEWSRLYPEKAWEYGRESKGRNWDLEGEMPIVNITGKEYIPCREDLTKASVYRLVQELKKRDGVEVTEYGLGEIADVVIRQDDLAYMILVDM